MKPIDPRLFRYSRSSRRFTIAATGIALLGAALTITQSALLAHFIVQIFVSDKSLNNLKSTLIWIAVIYILKAILNYSSERLAAVSSSLIRKELRSQLVTHLLSGQVDYKTGPAQLSLQKVLIIWTHTLRNLFHNCLLRQWYLYLSVSRYLLKILSPELF